MNSIETEIQSGILSINPSPTKQPLFKVCITETLSMRPFLNTSPKINKETQVN